MMKKIFAIITLVLFMFCAVGCEEQTNEKTSTGATTKAFIGGNKGLDLKFVEGAPPEEVYDADYPFNINLRLENVGEHDIPANEAEIKIVGIDPADFGNPEVEKSNTVELRGANLDPQGNEISGSIENIDFENLQASTVTGSVPYTIRGEVCYPYGTTAVSQICVLEDILGTTRKSGEEAFCEVTGDKGVENSGAPVKIENVNQRATGKDKISFSFDIAHTGNGLIFKKDSDCSQGLENKNKVNVKVTSGITGGELSCSGLSAGTEGELALYGEGGKERRTVVCTQSLPTKTDSEKQIKIELDYEYKQHIDTQIIVKNT